MSKEEHFDVVVVGAGEYLAHRTLEIKLTLRRVEWSYFSSHLLETGTGNQLNNLGRW